MYGEKGLAGFWYAALGRAGYRRLLLLERRLDEALPLPAADDATWVRPLRREDEDGFVALGQEGAATFRGRLEQGHQGWGAWRAGELLHAQWLATGEAWIEHLGCRVHLGDGVAYVYRAFTAPPWRGAGLTSAVHARALAEMRERGSTLALCGVAPGNRPALSPWLRLGYRRVGFARTFGAGRQRRLRVRAAPGSGASLRWRLETA